MHKLRTLSKFYIFILYANPLDVDHFSLHYYLCLIPISFPIISKKILHGCFKACLGQITVSIPWRFLTIRFFLMNLYVLPILYICLKFVSYITNNLWRGPIFKNLCNELLTYCVVFDYNLMGLVSYSSSDIYINMYYSEFIWAGSVSSISMIPLYSLSLLWKGSHFHSQWWKLLLTYFSEYYHIKIYLFLQSFFSYLSFSRAFSNVKV